MYETILTGQDLDKSAEVFKRNNGSFVGFTDIHLHIRRRGNRSTGGNDVAILHRSPAAELDLALVIDADALDPDAVTDLHDVLDLVHAGVRKLRDVHEAILAGHHLDKGTEILDGNNGSLVHLVDGDLLGHALDDFLGTLEALGVVGVDVDEAVGALFLHVDLRTGLRDDPLDGLATGADDEADLVLGDDDSLNAGGILAHLAAWCGEGLGHVRKDESAVLAGVVDGGGHELVADALELEVELEAGDSLFGSAELEVHVAEVILAADDVGQQGVAGELTLIVILGHQTHGDTGDGALDGNTRIHEGEHAGADGGHRGGAVGLHHLAGDAEGVREVFLARDDREDGALGEGSVTDLAAVLSSETAGLADTEGREVVVQQEALGGLAAAVPVDHLGLVGGAERRQGHRLGLATGKQSRSVGAGENGGLAGKLTELGEAPSVAALLLVEDADAEGLLLKVIESLRDFELRSGGEFLEDLRAYFLAQGSDGLATGNLAGGVEGRLDAVARNLVGDFKHRLVDVEERELALGLAGLGDELVLSGDQRTGLLAGKIKGLLEVLLGKLIGGTLDHDHLLAVSDVYEIEITLFALGVGGVHDELAVDAADTDCRDRLLERNVRDTEGSGGAINGEDVGIDLSIRGEQDADDLRVVEVVLGEERSQGAIGHACGKDLLLARTALALEVSSGELSDSGGFLLVVNGEGEEVLPLLDGGGGDGGNEDDGLARGDDDGAVGELGDLAGLEGDGILANVGRGDGVGHGNQWCWGG